MNGPNILLVEDNPDDEDLTRLAFSESGLPHTLTVARDGAAALDYFFGPGAFAAGQPDACPVLVLLDLKLPKVEGWRCCAACAPTSGRGSSRW
jgi:two-component system response regulator